MGRQTRRTFMVTGAAAAASVAAGCLSRVAIRRPETTNEKQKEDVAPAEDLMREHGVLNRILLIYDDVDHRLSVRQSYPSDVLVGAAEIIRRFIEDYHEKLEEDYLFPRFERAGRLVELVATLRTQHARGRALTADILQLAGQSTPHNRVRLRDALRLFVRMYRPHEAREDTVLFPAFHGLVSPSEYDSLGDVFEDKEHQLFGARGFEGIVEHVAQLEQALGIGDLDRFTPPLR